MKNTDVKLRNSSIYSVFLRNFSEEGTFKGLKERVGYIKDLGFDIVWLMPIHPIGEKNRKGELGSPYSIKDFYAIDPKLGTEEDFKELIDEVHNQGMKIIIDVVFHHTSWDSVLMNEHEEWFYHKDNGQIGNKVGDWYDIADLDFSHKGLWEYLLGALTKWVKMGVDGFRCDVAPLITMDFWHYIITELRLINPNLIFLSESVEPGFITYLRSMGHTAHSDCETFHEFDMLYDYDIKGDFMDFINNNISLKQYLQAVSRQEYIYPANYVKLRFLENHDNPRARSIIKDDRRRINFLSFLYFIKGSFLFFNGQETFSDKTPDLFNEDKIEWNYDNDVLDLIKELNAFKKDEIMSLGNFELKAITDNTVEVKISYKERLIVGYFNIGETEEKLEFEYEKDETSHKIINFERDYVTPIVIEVKELKK